MSSARDASEITDPASEMSPDRVMANIARARSANRGDGELLRPAPARPAEEPASLLTTADPAADATLREALALTSSELADPAPDSDEDLGNLLC